MGVWKSFAGTIVAVALSLPLLAGAKELKVGLKLEPSSIDPHYHSLTPNDALDHAKTGR